MRQPMANPWRVFGACVATAWENRGRRRFNCFLRSQNTSIVAPLVCVMQTPGRQTNERVFPVTTHGFPSGDSLATRRDGAMKLSKAAPPAGALAIIRHTHMRDGGQWNPDVSCRRHRLCRRGEAADGNLAWRASSARQPPSQVGHLHARCALDARRRGTPHGVSPSAQTNGRPWLDTTEGRAAKAPPGVFRYAHGETSCCRCRMCAGR